jgi:hypothetical protein
MDPVLTWIEASAFSIWMRESPSLLAFPAFLSFHAIGMGLAAGINAALALRILGVGPGIPLEELERFMPIMWAGFWMNAISGVGLFLGYPTKALTNPVFYLKLTFIAVALALVKAIGRRVFAERATRTTAGWPVVRRLAIGSLVCWTGAITAGRLLAYTYTRLLASWK